MQEIVSNYGLQVKGYFGLGQWMYQLLNGTMAYPVEEPAEGATAEETAAYEAEMEAWRALDLNAMLAYTAGEDEPEGAELDAAIALLEGAGWTLNAQGEAFDAANDDVRYKDVNGTLVPLSLKLAYAEGSSAAQAMENDLVAMLKAGGIELTVNAIPMADLLPQYYRMADAEYDMYFLATNFDLLYDPSTGFIENENGEHVWRTSGLVDEKLWNEAVGMRTTEPGDLLTYCTHWLAFQTEISDSLPILPIYSNVYFDFYGRVLHDYQVSMHASWPEALDAASLSEYVEETEELGEGEEEEFEG